MAKEKNKLADKANFVFGKNNYKIFISGIIVLAIGFLLMIGKEDIFDFRKITLAPIVIITGFIIIGYGIIVKPKEEK